MNKILFMTLLLLIAVSCVFALPVASNTAARVAGNFITERLGNAYTVSDTTPLESEYSSSYIYIVNLIPTGFVLVAADDAATPIIGYSTSNKWNEYEIPSQFAYMLKTWNDQMNAIVSQRMSADANIISQWQRYNVAFSAFTPDANYRIVSPLITSVWGQGTYYNALCPSGTPVGCVATAMAQIMKYWSFPTTGVGSHSYTDASYTGDHASYGVQTANFGTTTYNWAGMPNSVSSANTSVATLCYHAGVSVDMDYDPTGSGAYSTDVPNALISYFRYKNTAQIRNKSSYDTDAWDTLMRGELDNARPVYYSGSGSSGGHAFIVDGYTGTNSFHLNWGWDGWYNGYYTLAALNPGSDTFNTGQAAVIGIQPSETYATLNEGFEGTTFPPTGWTRSSTTWARNTTATYISSGSGSAICSGTSNQNNKRLVTPLLTIDGSVPLTYKARRGTTSYSEALSIQYSSNGTTWTTITTQVLSASFTAYSVPLTSLTPGDYYLGFMTTGATTTTSTKRFVIDEVTGPPKWVDPNPIAAINITSWAAGSLAPGGAASSGLSFQLSNVGQGTLTVTNTTNLSTTEFSSSLNPSIALVAGQVHEFGFTYEPLNYGTDNQSYVITTNGGTITITLSGSAIYTKFSDGFETYTDFALTMSPWTQYDGDGLPTYGVTGYTWLNTGYTGSYLCTNPYTTTPALGTGWEPHTGQKYAACWAGVPTTSVTANNDWLITPLISVTTGAQVSFWAKAYTTTYPERFKVRYSTTTNAVASFTNYLAGSASTYITPTTTWTLYTYTLPSNTSLYIGIQCVSPDAFAFMVDDFQVTDASTPPAPPDFGNVSGYVYRYGTSTPISNAMVTAGAKTAYTNAAGFYQINNLVVGTYAMSCNAEGQFYFSASQSGVAITVGNTTSQNFSLTWAELAANPTSLTASLYPLQTSDQNLAISNPGGTADLQYSMWLTSSSAASRTGSEVTKKLPATNTPNTHSFKPVAIPEIDRSEGWMGYANVADANYYTGAVTERASKFYIEDFGLWSSGVTISKLRHYFYELSTDLWGTNTTFIFKIYADNGTTVLYTSPSITANRYPTVTEHVLTTPLTVTSNFWVSVIPVDATTGKPQSLGTDAVVGDSWYGSSAAWTAMTLDLCLDAYIQGNEWISASQYSGTVAPAATQNVTMSFNSTGLAAGTKTAYLNIANNANYNPPPTRGSNMVIPVSLTVTIPSVPTATLNTTSWTTNANTGSPSTSGNVFTLTNVGTGTLTITSVSGLTGTPFTSNINTSITLAQNATHSFGFTFTPTANGVFNATFTINTNGGTKTVTLKGYANYVTEGFEGATFPPDGWMSYNVDADAYNWMLYAVTDAAHTGLNCAGSASYVNDAKAMEHRTTTRAALTPNNWLVTPRLTITTGDVISYWIAAQDPAWPAEYYSVKISTTNNQVASFTNTLFSETLTDGDWYKRTIDLSAYAGQSVYLAFQHYNCTDQFVLKLDDVLMPPLAAPLVYGNITGRVRKAGTDQNISGAIVTVGGRSFTTLEDGNYTLNNVVVDTYSITATATGCVNYSNSVTILQDQTITHNIFMDYAQFSTPTTTFNLSVAQGGTTSTTMNLSNVGTTSVAWTADSGVWGGDTFPAGTFLEDFEDNDITGWVGSVGAYSDIYGSAAQPYGYNSNNTWVFASNLTTTTQWIATPKIRVQTGDNLSFWYKQFNASSESFTVLVSTTTNEIASFSTLATVGPLADTNWAQFSQSLNAYAGSDIYIGFYYPRIDAYEYGYVMLDNITGGTAILPPMEWLSSTASGTLAAGGTNSFTLNVSAAGRNLPVGNYTAETWVFGTATNSPYKLNVNLTVTEAVSTIDPPANPISEVVLTPTGEMDVYAMAADVVPNANSYKIYGCDTPFGTYVLLQTATDPYFEIDNATLVAHGLSARAFFKVTADTATRNASVPSVQSKNSSQLLQNYINNGKAKQLKVLK